MEVNPGDSKTTTVLLKNKISIEEGFDPVNIDIGFVDEFTRMWPKDGTVDAGQVEYFATKALVVEDELLELIAKVIRYYECAKAEEEEEFAMGMVRSDAKSVAGQREMASKDTKYQEALKKEAKAKASLKFLTGKLEVISKMHYLCKDGIKAHAQIRGMKGGGSPVNEDAFGGDAVGKIEL